MVTTLVALRFQLNILSRLSQGLYGGIGSMSVHGQTLSKAVLSFNVQHARSLHE